MMDAVVEAFRGAAILIVYGEWEALDNLTDGGLSATKIREVVMAYGRTLRDPPSSTWRELTIDEVPGRPELTYVVRFPLWTVEEGPADLHIRMTAREVTPGFGIFGVEIDEIVAQ